MCLLRNELYFRDVKGYFKRLFSGVKVCLQLSHISFNVFSWCKYSLNHPLIYVFSFLSQSINRNNKFTNLLTFRSEKRVELVPAARNIVFCFRCMTKKWKKWNGSNCSYKAHSKVIQCCFLLKGTIWSLWASTLSFDTNIVFE